MEIWGKSGTFVMFSAACLTTIVIMGCPSQQSWIDKIGSDMDKIAKGYEKFGTVSMSSPILVEAKAEPNSGRYFDFNLPTDANDYYTDARANIQGQSAIFDQFAQTSRLGLTAQINLIALRGSAADINDYNVPAIKNVAPEVNQVLGTLSDSNFMKYLGLLKGSPTPVISNRSAITTAAGDTVTEGIFRLLGNPAEAMQFEDKIIMFGVSMVTVNPGWLTSKNYTAELAVSCDYSYEPARRELLIKLLKKEKAKDGLNEEKDKKLIDLINYARNERPISKLEANNIIPQRLHLKTREGYTPLSVAVSPMTDVDALDLASSQHLQISEAIRIAAALSYLGSEGQAEFIKEWVKRRAQDVRTRSAYAAVTAFSNGGFFGFRIRPRLKALENPALFGSKPGNVLEQQAFPVVVIVGIDRDDLQLGFDIQRDSNGKLRLVAYEPLIFFRQTVSWLPNKSTESFWKPAERLSETERLNWAYSYMQACENLNSADVNKKIKKFIGNRILLLDYHVLNPWNSQYIPIDVMVNKD